MAPWTSDGVRALPQGRPAWQRLGNNGHSTARDASESRFCFEGMAFAGNEFCRTPLVLAGGKLARNQMFTARCVLNMYLFGTFLVQNQPEIAPKYRGIPGPCQRLGQLGKRLPRLSAEGALAAGG
jgi:hypothetical protein